MKHRRFTAVARLCAVLAIAPALLAFALYPGGGFLGYTYLKWGEPAAPSGATVYWSLMPVGTGGSDYCGSACPGSSTLTLPNFYDHNTSSFRSVNLDDPEMLGHIRNALRTWGATAGVSFVYLPADSGVIINDPAALPPDTGHIRIGVFDMGDSGAAAVGYAPPPNGIYPGTLDFMTGAGDLLINSAYAYQNPDAAEGTPLDAFPAGGGPFLNDFEGLILHELGHALGIDHSDVADAVMCGWPHDCIYNDIATYAVNRQPGPDDVEALQTLYGPPVDDDLDGIADAIDNCSAVSNAGQTDSDGDGYGNACDADLDNNGFVNFTDLGLFRVAFGTSDPHADFDNNGFVNFIDLGRFRTMFGSAPGPSGLVPQ